LLQDKKLLLDESIKRRLALEENVTLIVSRTDSAKYVKLVQMMQRLRPDVGIVLLNRDVRSLLLLTCQEYSPCLTSYWSPAENILRPCS
jgi:hypothetical protein